MEIDIQLLAFNLAQAYLALSDGVYQSNNGTLEYQC